MSPLKRLFGTYQACHGHGRPLLKYVGIVAAATYVLFYLVRFTKPDPRPFDDIALRLVVVTLFILLALRDRWPARLRRFYLPFSYAALLVAGIATAALVHFGTRPCPGRATCCCRFRLTWSS